MPETYHFVTDWRFRAPLQKVWSVVLDIERYPGWWKNFRRVAITRGDGRSVGSVIQCEVRGSLPYSLNYALERVYVSSGHAVRPVVEAILMHPALHEGPHHEWAGGSATPPTTTRPIPSARPARRRRPGR